MKYAFNWSIIGTTIIENDSYDDAETQFEAMSMADMVKADATDVETNEIGYIDDSDGYGRFVAADPTELRQGAWATACHRSVS